MALLPESSYVRVDGPRTDVTDVTKFWLDQYGEPKKIVNALGDSTIIDRTHATWPAAVTHTRAPNGRAQAATYDTHGNLLTLVDSATVVGGVTATTQYAWNMAFDFVSQVTLPAGEITQFGYDGVGNRIWVQDGRGSPSRTTLDYNTLTNRVVRIRYPLSGADSIVHDTASAEYNLRGTRSGRGFWTMHYTDGLGRDTLVTTVTDTTHTGLSSSDATLTRVRTTYDWAGRPLTTTTSAPVTTVSPAESVFVQTTYDVEGHPLSVSRRSAPDSANTIGSVVTQFTYDWAGRKVKEIAPDGQADSTVYDPAGNAVTQRTRRGDAIALTYDALSRLTRRITPQVVYASQVINPSQPRTVPRRPNSANGAYTVWADTATFTYDAVSNLLTANNRDAQIRRTYNLNGTLATDTLRTRTYAELSAGGNFTTHVYGLSFGYDRNGRRLWLKHPGSVAPRVSGVAKDSVAYGFDATTGLLTSVRDPFGNQFRFTYDMESRPDSTIYPGGLTEKVVEHDADGLVRQRFEENHSGLTGITAFPTTTLRNELLARDAAGRVGRMLNTGGYQDTLWLTYTGLGALGSSTNSQRDSVAPAPGTARWTSNQENFRWDALGNRKLVWGGS